MPIDLKKLKVNLEKKRSATAGFDIKVGENLIRVLPRSSKFFTGLDDDFCFEYGLHYNVGVDDETVECLKDSAGKGHCPVCSAVKRLYDTGLSEDKAIAHKMRMSRRRILNVIDMKEVDKGIQIMETGPMIYDKIAEVVVRAELFGDVLDPVKGRSFLLIKQPAEETKNGFVNYTVTPMDPKDMTPFLPKNFNAELDKLEKHIPAPRYTAEELTILLEGGIVEKDPESVAGDAGNTAPEPAVKAVAPEPVVSDDKTPKGAAVVADKTACFGVGFSPKKEECKVCEVKSKCVALFMES